MYKIIWGRSNAIVNKLKIDPKYVDVNLTRTLLIFSVIVLYCVYLSIDSFLKGSDMVSLLALFCAIMTAIAVALLSVCKFGDKPRKALMHIAITLQCIVFWFTFGEFLYTGGTGGTSIFLIFASAPVAFFFFNLFYGSLFSGVLFVGMVIYMNTPLHLLGYQFPEMYYKRLPIMYLVEVIMCAIAQYETDKAKIQQDLALEEARMASEAKSDFLANTSHEIRTPINAVLGMNEMIIRETVRAESMADDDIAGMKNAFNKISDYAGNVDSAGNNLLAIINDILDFTKVEEGKMDIIEVDYQLSSVLNDVSNMIHFRAKEKNLAFIQDVDETLPDHLWGDEVRVRQVITNLLTNAVKYTDIGSVTLKIRSTEVPETADGHKMVGLEVSVTDTGRGIRPEDIDKLFGKFERIDMQKNSTIEGTGLGLAITKRLLDMMGGDISVDSKYGIGSVFTIMIPQRVVSYEPIGDFREKFKQNLDQKITYHEIFRAPDAKVLIVDDTRMNIIVAKEFLKDTQIQIDTASNGVEAVAKSADNPYDLILMDQRMPLMDGVEALHSIRKDMKSPNNDIPVICLTADAVIGAKERYLSQGFTDYLTKPIDSSALERMLKKYLPRDKVIVIKSGDSGKRNATDTSVTTASSDDGANYKALEEVGVDIVKGLSNCANDKEFYSSVLIEYLNSSFEKRKEMEDYLEKNDYENYGIGIHGLKSASATIGALNLSAHAAALERAAKSGDYEFVKNKHDEAMVEYDRILKKIQQTVTSTPSSDDKVKGSDGVMEFAPKGE